MSSSEIQIKFTTHQEEFSVQDSVFSVPGTISVKELNSMVNSLLKAAKPHGHVDVEFDFLMLEELIRSPLQDHIESKEASTEQVFEVKYFVKYPAPSPEDSLVHDDWVSGVRASDAWILTGCYDDTVHIWSISGEHKLTIPGHSAPVKSVAWIKTGDPISSFVSTSHDETAMLWQWNQHTNAVDCIHICKGHMRSVDCVSVNTSLDRFVTGSYDQMLKIWSADDSCEPENCGGDDDKKRLKTENSRSKVKTPLMTLSGHNDGIMGVQWIDTNEVCTCSLDSTLKVWDVELGGLKAQLNGSRAFLGISYSPLSKCILSASSDRHVRLWDPRSKEGALVKSVFSSHTLWISAVHWSPVDEHQFVSGSYDNFVKLWDTRSPKAPLFDISGHEDKVYAVDWSLKDFILSGGADNHVKMYRFKESRSECPMEV